MAEFLADKNADVIIDALQAVLPPMLDHWGDRQSFHKAATPLFMRKAMVAREEAARVVALMDQAMRQVANLRARQFRAHEEVASLDKAYERLVPTTGDQPLRQGFLWLAYQSQKAAIEYLGSVEGTLEARQLRTTIEDNNQIFHALLNDPDSLTLGKIEALLVSLFRRSLAEQVSTFGITSIAGHLIERARAEARRPPGQDLLTGDLGANAEEIRQIASLIEPVHAAELNEANQRFLRLSDAEKGRWFDILRAFLKKRGSELSRYAPQGFEKFCMALEAMLFPYPGALEWMRSYLKPMYTNAQQSSVFDNCLTETAIEQRYEKLMGEKAGNTLMIDLARAFALAKLNKLEDPDQEGFLVSLNLAKEFRWPTTLEEMKAQMK